MEPLNIKGLKMEKLKNILLIAVAGSVVAVSLQHMRTVYYKNQIDNKVIEKVGAECAKMRSNIIQYYDYSASVAYFKEIGLPENLKSRAMEECVRLYHR